MDPLLIAHAAVTCFLCGLAWTVQTVHYPLFAVVGPDTFVRYEREHQHRIARLVGPAMVIELALALALLATPGALPGAAAPAGIALLAWIWITTVLLAVPRHRQLASGFDAASLAGLMRAHRQRTAAWSLRAALSLWMLGGWEARP